MLLVLLFAAIGTPTGTQAISRPTPVFSRDDYPVEAVRNHWEGTVVAELTINPRGQVSACEIVQSSGHKVLDDATCDLITKRARFKPAKDSAGKPIEGKFRSPPITWRLGP